MEKQVGDRFKVFTDLQFQLLLDPSKRELIPVISAAHDDYVEMQRLWNGQLQQQAKMDWLEDGDSCSRLFFNSMRTRMKHNKIHLLIKGDGTVLNTRQEIVGEILQFYKALFGTEKEVMQIDMDVLD